MKIDLHRHFGGSTAPELIHKFLGKQGDTRSIEEVQSSMLFVKGESSSFTKFLCKFDILNEIKWNERFIEETIQQIVWDLVSEEIEYSEIHFSVNKYLDHLSWTPEEAILFIHNAFETYSSIWDISVGLVLSLKYESDRENQKKIVSVIDNPEVAGSIVGIDLVGNENFYNAEFYAPIFKQWKSAGKGLLAHVGESQSAENVRTAIEKLNVDRIAHGIKAADCPDILDLANDRGIFFDIALSSNLLTGVVDKDLTKHPVGKMLEHGCKITIGTDDPVTCSTTLNREYDLLRKSFNLSEEQVISIMDNSVEGSFK